MANAPLWGGMRKVLDVIWGGRKQEYFCKQGWTATSPNSPSGKSAELCAWLFERNPPLSRAQPERAHISDWERSDRLHSVGLPASEQSAHHAADQSDWTAATAVMMNATAATTAGRTVAIDFVTGARVRRRDGFGQ